MARSAMPGSARSRGCLFTATGGLSVFGFVRFAIAAVLLLSGAPLNLGHDRIGHHLDEAIVQLPEGFGLFWHHVRRQRSASRHHAKSEPSAVSSLCSSAGGSASSTTTTHCGPCPCGAYNFLACRSTICLSSRYSTPVSASATVRV